MRTDDLASNVEAESEPRLTFLSPWLLYGSESLEETGEHFGRHLPRGGVPDDQDHFVLCSCHINPYRRAWSAVLDRVSDEVRDHLGQPLLVPHPRELSGFVQLEVDIGVRRYQLVGDVHRDRPEVGRRGRNGNSP